MLEEFKKFAMRGNVLDLAVGVIIGASFTGIVTSLVNDIIMPPVGLAPADGPPDPVPRPNHQDPEPQAYRERRGGFARICTHIRPSDPAGYRIGRPAIYLAWLSGRAAPESGREEGMGGVGAEREDHQPLAQAPPELTDRVEAQPARQR